MVHLLNRLDHAGAVFSIVAPRVEYDRPNGCCDKYGIHSYISFYTIDVAQGVCAREIEDQLCEYC